LVRTVGIPSDDRFQRIKGNDPGTPIHDPGSLGIDRSEDSVTVRIMLVSDRPRAPGATLHGSIAGKLPASAGVPPADVLVCLVENDIAEWSAGRGEAPLPDRLQRGGTAPDHVGWAGEARS
jgi:hypothetical protein